MRKGYEGRPCSLEYVKPQPAVTRWPRRDPESPLVWQSLGSSTLSRKKITIFAA
jgi:hypothetical protein